MNIRVERTLNASTPKLAGGNDSRGLVHRGLRAAMALIAVIGVSQSAHAVSGWTAYGRILEIYPSISGNFYVNIEIAPGSNPHPCTYAGWFSNSDNNSGANRVFAALLSAQATGALVKVHAAGTCSTDGYTVISSASVKS